MFNATFAKVVLLAASVVPLAFLRGEDDPKSDDNQPAKGRPEVQVRVEVRGDDADGARKVEKKVRVEVLNADESGKGKPTVKLFVTEASENSGEKQTYLGIGVEPVPPVLVAHLPGILAKDQGILVGEVAADSPAAKAGLKEFDILVSYDEQKLFSGEQLTKLVRGDKPGREVVLGVIRGGKQEKVKATLADHEARAMVRVFGGDEHGKAIRALIDQHGQPGKRLEILKELREKDGVGGKAEAGAQVKGSFSSMTLKSLDGDRFKAEIEYKNEKGDTLKRSFEGTRDEIRKEIEGDKEVPDGIRHQLLRSLDVGGKGGRPGSFRFMTPGAGGNFSFDFGDEDFFKTFNIPGNFKFDDILQHLPNDLDAQVREKLKDALRSIEEPRKKSGGDDRPL